MKHNIHYNITHQTTSIEMLLSSKTIAVIVAAFVSIGGDGGIRGIGLVGASSVVASINKDMAASVDSMGSSGKVQVARGRRLKVSNKVISPTIQMIHKELHYSPLYTTTIFTQRRYLRFVFLFPFRHLPQIYFSL